MPQQAAGLKLNGSSKQNLCAHPTPPALLRSDVFKHIFWARRFTHTILLAPLNSSVRQVRNLHFTEAE